MVFPALCRSRKKLGLIPRDGNIAHHLLPFILGDHKVVQAAAKAGWHMNDIENLKKIEKALHSGSHINYTTRVRARLEAISIQYGPNMSPQQAKDAINQLVSDITSKIESQVGVNIDNIVF